MIICIFSISSGGVSPDSTAVIRIELGASAALESRGKLGEVGGHHVGTPGVREVAVMGGLGHNSYWMEVLGTRSPGALQPNFKLAAPRLDFGSVRGKVGKGGDPDFRDGEQGVHRSAQRRRNCVF